MVPDLLQKSMPTFYNLYQEKQNIQRYNLLRQRKQDKHCKMLQLIWMMLLCRCQRFVLLSSLSVLSKALGKVISFPQIRMATGTC